MQTKDKDAGGLCCVGFGCHCPPKGRVYMGKPLLEFAAPMVSKFLRGNFMWNFSYEGVSYMCHHTKWALLPAELFIPIL